MTRRDLLKLPAAVAVAPVVALLPVPAPAPRFQVLASDLAMMRRIDRVLFSVIRETQYQLIEDQPLLARAHRV